MAKLFREDLRHTRGTAGNVIELLVLLVMAAFMAFPLVYIVSNAFKPLSELFIYPPKFFPISPTLGNFRDLIMIMNQSWVPFTRYLFNTVMITIVGTAGHLFLASMAAFVLAKHQFPWRNFIFRVIVLALMFTPAVTGIPNYIVMTQLNLVDTYWATLLPGLQSSLGLYLMKQFMETVPDAVLESARIDGATEVQVYWKITMPMVKPAWLTLIILSVQSYWNLVSPYTYSEQLKTLPQAMQQIISGGIARTGVSSAVALVMMLVPLMCFILSQSNVIETMSTSGMKD